MGNFTSGRNENSTLTADGDSIPSRMFQLALLADKYYTPFLCIFGILGNLLSLLVFYVDAKYRSQSAPYYLSALAVSDTGFLVNLFLVWLENVNGGGVITSDVACPLVMYLGQVTGFMSVYLVVAFSIERYVAVHYPFSRPRLCTRSKAKKVIGGLTLVALVAFSYVWWIAEVIEIDQGTNSGISSRENLTGFQQVLEFPTPNEQFEEVDASGSMRSNNPALMNSKNPLPTSPFSPEYGDELGKKSLSERLRHYHPNSDQMLSSWESNPPGKHSRLEQHDHNRQHHYPPMFRCSVPKKYYKISEVANYFDSVVTLLVPFVLIIFCNMKIAMCVWKVKNQREEIMVMGASSSSGVDPAGTTVAGNYADETVELDDDDTSRTRATCIHLRPIATSSRRGTGIPFMNQPRTSSSNIGSGPKKGVRFQGEEKHEEQQQGLLVPSSSTATPSTSRSARSRLSIIRESGVRNRHISSSAEVRVTKTLLLISCMFLMLNLPAHVLRCAQFIQSVTGSTTGKDYLAAALPWTYILFNTSFAVNFLLYCGSGRNFRISLINILYRIFRRRRSTSNSSPPQSSFLARMRRKRKSSAGLTTATSRLSTSAINEDSDGDGDFSALEIAMQASEAIQLEPMAKRPARANISRNPSMSASI